MASIPSCRVRRLQTTDSLCFAPRTECAWKVSAHLIVKLREGFVKKQHGSSNFHWPACVDMPCASSIVRPLWPLQKSSDEAAPWGLSLCEE